ncbi:hypothetical protein LCGC14_0765170 [marine sediment metagenome]|uniref:Uncharacterized protein n=1 Tax=marine sediment metagenome TaxID=412755 RepID=A0A0F9Q483_9ZZZZ
MTKTESLPKWATLDRKAALVQLFVSSGGFCVFGHEKCLIPEHHYYIYTEFLIKDWQQLDKDQQRADWKAEQQAIHSLGEQSYPVTGRFSAISKEIYASSQPLYYLQGQAVSGLTLKPFVAVRLSSSYMHLHIDLGDALRQVSKSKRRKAIRYGKPFPREIEVIIRRKVFEAVKDYLAH